jgi:predicted dehydrogenase
MKIRIGFIGGGGIASRHISNLMACDNVELVGVADPMLGRAEAAAVRFGGQAYAHHEAMLDNQALDAVYICVPPFAHGPLEVAALERRVPFFIEKPLALDYTTAQAIAAAVEAQGLITAVGYHWRYLDIVERAQELVHRNPARLALGYWLAMMPPAPWWRRHAQSGGQMIEQTTHIFDLTRLLVGEVETVHAVGASTPRESFPDADICEVSVATLRFATGAVGTIASTCLLNWHHRIGLHLFCNAMVLEISENAIMIDVGRGRPVTPAQGDPFVREDRDFLDAVRGKANRIRVPYREALQTHRLATGAEQSLREGRMVHFGQGEEAHV